MNAKYNYFIAACCTLVVACGSDVKKPTTISSTAPIAKPSLMEPFRFHKAIEVAPGQTYDVVSWGRGSKSAGAYAILHSDSANIKYTTTTGDLDGNITDVYNADMDLDGNPEILIQSKGKDTVNYAKVYAFEFNNNDEKDIAVTIIFISKKESLSASFPFTAVTTVPLLKQGRSAYWSTACMVTTLL
jgi:hypothetical protein